ncbi:arg-6, mitochondrial precursor [Trichoderma arundinaceum]|uniref:Arg-6, mitochondrial n=1 Tax=Trichoderma arundinaceum TaxID=490622 RepID=A0A395NXN8_TRIAR|nr:arg-6, mitochondrial precursor [Trichoderma arundinaceum]
MLSATSVAVRSSARQAIRPSAPIAAAPISNRCHNRSFSISSTRALAISHPCRTSHSTRKVLKQTVASIGNKCGYATTTNPNPPLGKKNASNNVPSRIGLIGARGYTGQALIDLLNDHPLMDLRHVSSRELTGQELQGYTKRKIIYENLLPEDVARLDKDVDCWVMALPNNVCKPYIEALDRVQEGSDHKSVVVDLSADYRFDSSFSYGLPELTKRSEICQSTRISNPGCYATAAQLAIAPLVEHLDGQPVVFGVSGYSGAGAKPNEKNDVNRLRDNIIPYSLTGHIHEREISHHLGTSVAFMPHVASWFRGIHLSVTIPLNKAMSSRDVLQLFQDRYAGEKLVKVVGEPPLVRSLAKQHHCEIGGFVMDSTGKRVVV